MTAQEPRAGRELERAETQAAILGLIEGLPANQQEVVRLKFQHGFSYKEIARITDIPAGKLGVLTRLYGKELPPGEIIAGGDCAKGSPGDTKGLVAAVLRPGKYRINPRACQVQLFDAITIRPGAVGVVTSLVGRDVLGGKLPSEARNTYLVGENMKGVVPGVLDPGTYYLNPYLYIASRRGNGGCIGEWESSGHTGG